MTRLRVLSRSLVLGPASALQMEGEVKSEADEEEWLRALREAWWGMLWCRVVNDRGHQRKGALEVGR
eukprot:8140565-Pyramimonas_sp.AAC.1